MRFCLNPRCRAVLGEHYWGEGYCGPRCQQSDDGYGGKEERPLMAPDDPTAEVARNRDEVDAMLEAAAIDPRLPKIIYLRKRGATLREIGRACGCSRMTCDRLLSRVTPILLRQCGL